MNTMDQMIESIMNAYDRFQPNMSKDHWMIMHLETLLDNLLLDKNELEQYYINFISIIRSM